MRRTTLTAFCLALTLMAGVGVLAQRPPVVAPPPGEDVLLPPAIPNPLPPAQEAAPTAGSSVLSRDNPMDEVEAFVEESRKKADATIAKLTKEAETLRARLEQVDAALERWKTVAAGLEKKPGDLSRRGFRPAREAPSTILTPAPIESEPRDLSPAPTELPPAAERPR